jgi:hypothetical protein
MRWAGHVARMGETRNAYRILVGKPEEKKVSYTFKNFENRGQNILDLREREREIEREIKKKNDEEY